MALILRIYKEYAACLVHVFVVYGKVGYGGF